MRITDSEMRKNFRSTLKSDWKPVPGIADMFLNVSKLKVAITD